MTTTATYANINATRPADPREISFARDCFETVGERPYWTVEPGVCGGCHQKARVRYYSLAEAEAKRFGTMTVVEHTETIQRRVKWN